VKELRPARLRDVLIVKQSRPREGRRATCPLFREGALGEGDRIGYWQPGDLKPLALERQCCKEKPTEFGRVEHSDLPTAQRLYIFNLIALEEDSLRKLCALPRNGGNLLRLDEPVRQSAANLFKESA
jgi:hypothetical protein